jgi:uncharacterized protein
VKVLEVDEARQRIGLTLRLDDEVGAPRKSEGPRGGQPQRQGQPQGQRQGQQRGSGGRQGGRESRPDNRAPAAGSMAEALRKAGFGK